MHKKNKMLDKRSIKSHVPASPSASIVIQSMTSQPAGWKAKFLSERSMTVIFGMFCILSLVFSLWTLYRSGVSMKRIESMNHTLADLMVKRHEDSNRQPTPIKTIIPEAKLPPSVEQSIYDLKRKTNEMTKAQLDRKADFERIIKAKQNEISQVSDMSSIQTKVKQTVAEISKETSEVKMDMESIRRDTFNLTSPPSFPSAPKVEEVSEDLIDEDELKRDLELLDCR